MTNLAFSLVQYVDATQQALIPAWIANHPYAAGTLMTNAGNSPGVHGTLSYVCIVAGTSFNGAEPTFNINHGGLTTDGTVTWQECSGQPGVNGDTANSPVWTANLFAPEGIIIYDSTSGSLQICNQVAGFSMGASKPTFSATAGVITTDNGVAGWTSLGLASHFGYFAAPLVDIRAADAVNWGQAGSINLVGDDHSVTQSVTNGYTGGSGTAAAPTQYICVSHTNPLVASTGATEITTGASPVSIAGNSYYNGITWQVGSGNNIASLSMGGTTNTKPVFENCTFDLVNTSVSSTITLGSGAGTLITSADFIGCNYILGSTSQVVKVGNGNIIGGTFFPSGSVPTTALASGNTGSINVNIRDVDLSKITGTLFTLAAQTGLVTLMNNKVAVGVAQTTGAPTNSADFTFRNHNYGSGATNYQFYETNYLGTIQQETTIVDNTNKATNGTTQWSINLATSAHTTFGLPYTIEFAPFEWQNTTGSPITLTMEINSNVALTNANVWMEVEYPGSSATPLGSRVTSRVTPNGTPTTYTTSTDSWGGSKTHQQQMSVTFTPQMVGPIKIRLYAAIPSTTIYISPAPVISGVTISRTYIVPGMGIANETSSGGAGGGTPVLQSGIIQGLGVI